MWPTKNKVSNEECGVAMESEIKSAAPCRSRRSERIGADEHLRKFFSNLASNIEALIDATPFGVTTPCEPWSPSTDKKKALLSNPISVVGMVGEVIDAFSPAKLFISLGAGRMMLMSLRDALANAVLAEEAMGKEGRDDGSIVMVEPEVDVTVPSEGAGESFVDLGADQNDNSPKSKGIKKNFSNFLIKRAVNIIDALTLRVNGIIITSDDCSVECSLDSLIDGDEYEKFSLSFASDDIWNGANDFEECPSVVTEAAEEDELKEEDTEGEDAEDGGDITKDEQVQDSKCDDDDGEYVIANAQPAVNEEDFVDVHAEFDDTVRP
jgi:hypothetical protein